MEQSFGGARRVRSVDVKGKIVRVWKAQYYSDFQAIRQIWYPASDSLCCNLSKGISAGKVCRLSCQVGCQRAELVC